MFTLPSVNTLLKTPTMYHLKPFSFFVVPVLLIACGFAGLTKQAVGQTVRFETNVGNIQVQLHPNDAPIAVANFLSYVNAAAGSNYEGTFFHRSINNFIIQGGGFYIPVGGIADPVPVMTEVLEDEFGMPVLDEFGTPIEVPITVDNEFGISNTRGTLAFAKLGGDPDSATNQWFFNTADNSGVPPLGLDFQNGGFTVFGTVVSGLDVVDAIQAVDTFNLDAADPGTFDNVPLINNGADFVAVNRIVVVPVLLGDVNLDGAVTFGDIPPFIELLISGGYQGEADCDQSAMVEFADIPPFIAILIDQAGSQ